MRSVAGVPVVAAALFGSRARGDHMAASDVDVLLWTKGSYPRLIRRGRHALAFYPETQLLQKAAVGDLFAAHIVLEAKCLFDPGDRLGLLRRRYAPPASYEPQVAAASDLAWFLLARPSFIPIALLNARAAWCARTIGIARTAETGDLIFGTQMLAERFRSKDLFQLVQGRDGSAPASTTARCLERFVHMHGTPPRLADAATAQDHFAHFSRTGNEFALKTIRQMRLKRHDGSYM